MRLPVRLRFNHLVLAVVLILALAALASLASTQAASPLTPLNVLVTNPPSAPVPTAAQGTTSVVPGPGAPFRVLPGAEPVTLNAFFALDPGLGQFSRVFPNGTSGNDEFIVPEGKILVITDITWNGFVPGGTPDRLVQFFISNAISDPPPGGYGEFVYVSRARLGSDSTAIFSESLTSGFVIGANRQAFIQTEPSSMVPGAMLHGFLVPAQ